ncbi:nucleotide exchange factor GrpE [Thermosulfuriphilus ammonigenes]|uniref:Protein GrpE n=2 Tax=Thermosulfuriphilus ammonigenes TaxID=1936021 RepID=A0A6G7PXJ7_9BACT|nr:nucleotide exchange factor GrpE [Thermosulfuriphilus ammonigenes]
MGKVYHLFRKGPPAMSEVKKENHQEKEKESLQGQTEAHPEAGEQSLEEQLKAAQLEAKRYYDQMLRLAAELENFKKQVRREKEEYAKYALEGFVRELLPFVDNLERALEHAQRQADVESLIQGIELTLKGFLKTLEKFGLTQFEAVVGETFNPEIHEALMVEETHEHEEGAVVKGLQKGYRLHERVLRPALVVVAKKPKEDQPSQKD